MSIDRFTRLLEALPALEPWVAVLVSVLAAIFCSKQPVLRLVQTVCNAIDRQVEERSRDRELQRLEKMSVKAYRRDREMETLRLDRGQGRRRAGQPGCAGGGSERGGLDPCREP